MSAARPPSESPVLDVRGLTIRADERTLVSGIDLTLRRGEMLGMVGASGSGKTLTAFALSRLLPDGLVQEGEITLEGRRLDTLDETGMRRLRGGRIGMVSQDPLSSFNPVRPIGAVLVESIQRHQGLDRAAARRMAVDILTEMRLPGPDGCVDAYPHALSGGQRQRAMIGLALANRPALIVADEPTTALDPTIQLQILALLRRQSAEAAGLLITHDIAAAAAVCDRLAVMRDGRIVEEGPTDRVLDQPEHPFTRELLSHAPGGERFR